MDRAPWSTGTVQCPEPGCFEKVEVGCDAGTPYGTVLGRIYECPKGHRIEIRIDRDGFKARLARPK